MLTDETRCLEEIIQASTLYGVLREVDVVEVYSDDLIRVMENRLSV